VNGYNARLGGGIDWYLTDAFSLGANVSGDMMFLKRPAVDVADLMGSGADTVYAADGSSIGSGLAIMAVIGVHL
jgi:hypothetical protein